MVIGSGSASFEMLRYLTERLPIMVTPRWVDNRIQPIAVRDVLRYLIGSAQLPPEVNRSFDIGGPDVLTYRDMMQSYAKTAGLTRRPLPTDPDWAGETSMSTSASDRSTRHRRHCGGSSRRSAGTTGGTRSRSPGGYAGLLDRLSGGPGLRRGRRNPRDLVVGDALDWWRVEAAEDGRFLRLRAEMRLPGLAWLELEVDRNVHGDDQGTTTFRQRALFHPRGFLGHAYRWSVWPFHGIVFGGMQRNVARAAESLAADPRADLNA